MKLESSFPVPASPDKVLSLFLDPGTMHACIPGCEELEQVDEAHYRGTLVNEVAHVKFKAGFVVDVVSTTTPSSISEPAVVVAVLKGEDRRLGSTIKIDATLTVAPADAEAHHSEVSYDLEMAMWGKLGRLGEAVVRRRTAEVEKQFAEALTAVCSGQPVPVRTDKRTGKRAERAQAGSSPSVGEPVSAPSLAAPAQAPASVSNVQLVPARRTEDLVILALTAAAAFAYGALFGGRRGASHR